MAELTEIENLKSARAGFIKKLADVANAEGHKPTYSIDGQRVDWVQYYKFLSGQIDSLNKQINALEPFEFVTEPEYGT